MLIFNLVKQYKALRFQSHWQISNIICSVARLQNLAFIEVSPSPLFMFMVGWISNCEIEILKWFRGDPPPHTPFYSTSHSDSLWFFQCFILYIIWCINKKKLLFHSNQFLSSKCLISDLRKRQVLLGATINFWLRLATLRKTATEWLVLQYTGVLHHRVRDNTMKWLVNLRLPPSPGDWCELITENKVLLCSEQRKKYGDVSVPFDEREKKQKCCKRRDQIMKGKKIHF